MIMISTAETYTLRALKLGELAGAIDLQACTEDLDLVRVHG